MRNRLRRMRGLSVRIGVAAVVATTSLVGMACGQEFVPTPPPGYQALRPGDIVDTREIRNSVRRPKATQLFSETQNECETPKIVAQTFVANHPVGPIDPIASQLFERATKVLSAEFGDNVTFRITMPRPGCLLEGVCGGSTCCEEMLDRMAAVPEIKEYPLTNFAAKFIRLGCPCTVDGDCHCAAQAGCGSECAAATGSTCRCCPCGGQQVAVTCNGESCEVRDVEVKHAHVNHHNDVAHHDPHELLEHIAELMAEKAAAQAALEVRKESEERFGQLFEAMAEVIADNAALDAKLEAQVEQRKLLEKVAELAVENARLKVHMELTAEKAEIQRTTNSLTLENERLKLRLAELEHKQAAAEAARTAAKPNRERKPR